MLPKYYLSFLFLSISLSLAGQQKVGINTTSPVRSLDIYGSGDQFLRLRTSSGFGSAAGLELIRGTEAFSARDWKLESSTGDFKILTGTDNFNTAGDEALRFTEEGYLGIGTISPVTRLHIDGGSEASNASDGYMMIGSKTGLNMVFDANEIITRNNGQPATLNIQTGGGNTWFGGGNIFIPDAGRVSLGGSPLNGRFNIEDSDFQVYLRNDEDDVNDWYIGASDDSWSTGDNLLLFSPTSSSANATLRLKDVTENDGFEAPVMITTSSTQTLYFDGNEIDSKSPLYINHNSNEETYFNPSGGRVGIGTTNPDGQLHVNTDEVALSLNQGFHTFWITPVQNGNMNFFKNTSMIAYVSYNGGGEWVAVSDRRLKNNIRPLGTVMDRINKLTLYTYALNHQPTAARDMGVIAQELQPLFPETVHDEDDQFAVSYDQLTVIAIKGIQEQQSQLEAISAQIDLLLEKN